MKKINIGIALEKRGAKLESEQAKFIDAVGEELDGALEERDLSLTNLMEDKIKALKIPADVSEELRNLAEKIEKQTGGQVNISELQKRTLRNKIKENHTAIVEAFRSKKPLDLFEIRVAAPHLNSNGTVALGTQVGSGTAVVGNLLDNIDESNVIATIRRPDNFIYDVIFNTQVSKVPETVIKTEQSTVEGSVAVVAEANAKPLVQYKWVKTATKRKKYAGRIEWSEEFEIDQERIFAEVVRMIERDVLRAVNNGLYADIVTLATAYTSSAQSGTVILPNVTDLAIVLQGVIANQNYSADTVLINSGRLVDLLVMKTAEGAYIVNPMFANGNLNGMRVIGTPTVATTDIVVMESAVWRERHTGVIMRIGTYNEQFITNEMTLIAEIFSVLEIANIDRVGVMKATIATALADLKKA